MMRNALAWLLEKGGRRRFFQIGLAISFLAHGGLAYFLFAPKEQSRVVRVAGGGGAPVVQMVELSQPSGRALENTQAEPTKIPTPRPTSRVGLKKRATETPTPRPTTTPTATPTTRPSATPTSRPSATPTSRPTPTVVVAPTATATLAPSATRIPNTPRPRPTSRPTSTPSVVPTSMPSSTAVATGVPTHAPTLSEARATVEPVARRRPVDDRYDEVLGRYTGESSGTAGGAGAMGFGGPGSEQGSSEYDRYVGVLFRELHQAWTWPYSNRQHLEARVLMRLDRSGGVIMAKVVTSSGNPSFDASVLRAVALADPLPPPPASQYERSFKEVYFTFRPDRSSSN